MQFIVFHLFINKLVFHFKERLNLVSILGAGNNYSTIVINIYKLLIYTILVWFNLGLLVGTALVVIIPEGTQMLYSQEMQGLYFGCVKIM